MHNEINYIFRTIIKKGGSAKTNKNGCIQALQICVSVHICGSYDICMDSLIWFDCVIYIGPVLMFAIFFWKIKVLTTRIFTIIVRSLSFITKQIIVVRFSNFLEISLTTYWVLHYRETLYCSLDGFRLLFTFTPPSNTKPLDHNQSYNLNHNLIPEKSLLLKYNIDYIKNIFLFNILD